MEKSLGKVVKGGKKVVKGGKKVVKGGKEGVVKDGILEVDFGSYYEPSPKQCEAHACPERFILFGGAMGGGKSVWLCAEAIQLSLDFPNNRGYLCRHENVVFKKTTGLTLDGIMPWEAVTRHNKSEQFYEFFNGSRIYYGGLRPTQTQKPLDRIKSLDLGWFGIDEATETREDYFLMLMSRFRLGGGIIYRGMLTSNPEPGWVKSRFIDRKRSKHAFIPALPSDNPFLPDDYEEGLRAEFSEEWVRRYLEGDWEVISDEAQGFELVPFSWIRAAQRLDEEAPGGLLGYIERTREAEVNMRSAVEKDSDGKAVTHLESMRTELDLGIDLAGGGGARTVFAIRFGRLAAVIDEMDERNSMKIVRRIGELITNLNPDAVKVDATGMGGPIADRLAEIHGAKLIVPFIAGGTQEVADPDRFTNCRSEGYWQLREAFEDGRLVVDKSGALAAQLSTLRYFVRGDKKISLESKEAMRKRGLRSPDYADAVMMSLWRPPISRLSIYGL